MAPGESPSRRPEFRPPEEFTAPPPVEATTPERAGRRVPAVLAAGVALLAGAGVLWWSGFGTSPRPSARPAASPTVLVTPTGPMHARLSSSGRVLRLPLLFPVLDAMMPQELRWYGPSATAPGGGNLDDQLYLWGAYGPSKARAMRVEIIRHPEDWYARDALIFDRAGCTGDGRLPCAGYAPPGDESYQLVLEAATGRAQDLPHLGTEAFAVSVEQHRYTSPAGGTPTYDLGGAVVESRVGNVSIRVDWLGADYPPAAAGQDPLHGTSLSYKETRAFAVKLTREIVERLTKRH
jgi:hypothetical protein